jgi:drug/metabolite transporter (DMT)-like permease
VKPKSELTRTAFATLLLVGFIMGANHVAARIAFNHGLDVGTAVTVRSCVTAIVVTLLIVLQGVRVQFSPRHKKVLPVIGILMAVQSLTIYSAVMRLPVSLALLAFNTYPLWIALWARVFYGHRPEPQVLRAMPILLIGLAFALDVFGATSGLGVQGQWALMGIGVAFALTAAATFGLAMVLTQHEAADLDGRVRTATTMWMVGMLALIGTQLMGSFHWPDVAAGWWGLAALSVLYGTGFTIMFTVLPRLGVVGNSAIMNVEPIMALILAWLILGQSIAFIQVVGALIVVGTVIKLGLRKQSK